MPNMPGKKVTLNKSVLNKQKKQLQTYHRFLPALELKQQQLTAEKKKAENALQKTRQQLRNYRHYVEQNLPMLGCGDISLRGMVKLKEVKLMEEHVVGVTLPEIKETILDVVEYGYLSKPHWVDACIKTLKEVMVLEVKAKVQQERVARLQNAARAATQRVNLFSKILIPETQQTIKKIQLYLSDMETASVVRSKMTKQKSHSH